MYEGFALRKELADENLKEARLARIQELETEVLEQAAGVICAILSYHEVLPNQAEPPLDWVERYGIDAALKRLAIAKSGWLPPSLAPSGGTLACKIMAGINRGRNHTLRVTQNNLNVKIGLPAPTTREHPGPATYEVRDLEE